MTVLRSLQDFLEKFPGMQLQKLGDIRTDFTKLQPASYALAPTGRGSRRKDVLGNRLYVSNYVFYAKELATDEADRASTYDFLDSFTEWLEEQDDAGDYPQLSPPYTVESISVNSGVLFNVRQDGTAIYQVQIQVEIKKGSAF